MSRPTRTDSKFLQPVREEIPFWRTKTLSEMTDKEWESLCDGCGRCCLLKLEDTDTGVIDYTDAACKLLDLNSCKCSDYPNRKKHVSDCIKLTAAKVEAFDWMPDTCGYRLIAAGRDLYWWHPLVSGDPETVHDAGISVRGRCVPEAEAGDTEERIVTWPKRIPRPMPKSPQAHAPRRR
jgi:uncharacterized cysteine cluster protein YcgN (CxxCxxCC family)